MNPLDLAIHRTAHGFPGGLPALAAALKIREQVLRNKVCPTSEWNKLGLREAMQMMLLTGDAQILEAMAAELGYSIARRDSGARGSLLSTLLKEQREHGDVARVLTDILEDGLVTQREASDISVEIQQAIEALENLRASVRAAAESGAVALPVEATHA